MYEKPVGLSEALKCFLAVIVFGIAFGYIEAVVVVYLREIFFPEGFVFPLVGFGEGPLWGRILGIEMGRETATLILILSAVWLFGKSRQQRFAYFLIVFAVWDIFYYVWLKVLTGWPGSIMDWDLLFLMPAVWASPVLAPIIVSVVMLLCGVAILYRDFQGGILKASLADKAGFFVAGFAAVFCFCIAGQHISEPDFKVYFCWPLFAFANVAAVAVFLRCFFKAGVDIQKKGTC